MNIKVIDMHCDTLYELDKQNKSLSNNDLHIDLEKLNQGNYMLQNFAVYSNLNQNEGIKHVYKLINLFNEEMALNKDKILPVRSYNDIEAGIQNNQLMAMLTIEEAGMIDSLTLLEDLYNQGVRMITLTWNYPNIIGHPNCDANRYENGFNHSDHQNGLTEYGISFVKKCEELGIIIDVSHASAQVFEDVLTYTTKPFVASHSNCRSLCNHSRNLTDTMIKELDERGGVMGINFYQSFVKEDGTYDMSDLINHLNHIKSIASIDVIGLGSDFDGIDKSPVIKDASYMPNLIESLRNVGWTQEEIEKVCYKNVLRLYQQVLDSE